MRDRFEAAEGRYTVRDFWMGAFIHLMGVPLLETILEPDGRVTFVYDDTNGQAYQAGLEFRAESGRDLVPLKAYRQSYRKLQDEARRAKAAGFTHDVPLHN